MLSLMRGVQIKVSSGTGTSFDNSEDDDEEEEEEEACKSSIYLVWECV